MDLDATNIRKVQELQDAKTCQKYMIPEGMGAEDKQSLTDRLSLPEKMNNWNLSQDSSP